MKKVFSVILCVVMVCSAFVGCQKNKEVASPVPTATPGFNILPDDEVLKTMNLSDVSKELTDTAAELMEKEDGATTIYVKDYGAVGDGKTSDKTAVRKAINALRRLPAGSTLEFEADKTYYLGDKATAITLGNLENCIVKGSNTTILIDAPSQYMTVQACKNVIMQGFNFNYKTKPYAFTKSVDKVTNEKKEYSVEVTLDRSLGIKSTYTSTGLEFFGVLNREDGRYHMSIKSIEVIDASAYKYKITFNNTSAFHPISDSLTKVSTDGMIVPVPNIGHAVEQAFTIISNENFTMKDCNIWSACKFMFFVKANEGKIVFDNTNVTPDPAEETNGDIRIVGWRDGFHCKENRAQLIWNSCTLEWVYDDIFNICCSMLKVESVSKEKIELIWPEANAAYGLIKKGDTVSFYAKNGTVIGTSKVKTVSGDVITIEDDFDGIEKGVWVAVESLGAPNSQLLNCKVKGTIRFRSPMYIYNSDIHCTRMWLAFETAGSVYLEGPCPHDIFFSNTRFTFDNTDDKYIEIYSSSSKAAKKLKDGELKPEEAFHVNNIVFYNCELDAGQIELNNSELYCDDVYSILP